MQRTNFGKGAARKKKAKPITMPPPQPSPQSRHTPEMMEEMEQEMETTVAAPFSAVPPTIPVEITDDDDNSPPTQPQYRITTSDGKIIEASSWQDLFAAMYPSGMRDEIRKLHETLLRMGYRHLPSQTTTTVSTQTEATTEAPLAKTTECVSTQTLPPPKCTYAEAVTQTPPPQSPQAQNAIQTTPPTPPSQRSPRPPIPRTRTQTPLPLITSRAVVIHGIKTTQPLPITTRKVELEVGKEAIGTRWLLPAVRRKDKLESSIVMYFLEDTSMTQFLYFGGRRHRVESYEWNRGSKG